MTPKMNEYRKKRLLRSLEDNKLSYTLSDHPPKPKKINNVNLSNS